jgi:predicted transcriptional regulator
MSAMALAPTGWLIMSCVWDLETADPVQVAARAGQRYNRDVAPKTAATLLERLEREGYLRSEPQGAGRRYIPLVPRDEGLRRQFATFLDQHYVEEGEREILAAFLASDGLRTRPTVSTADGSGGPVVAELGPVPLGRFVGLTDDWEEE